MMMFAPGWIEILLLMSMGGGAGLPLGVPPGPEDPLMKRVPADECIFYTSWSGVTKPDATSGNRTEALLAEKEIQHALAEIEKVVTRGLKHAAQEGDEVQAIMFGELFPRLGKLALTRPTCFYVTKFALKAGVPDMQGGMVIRVDEEGADIQRIMKTLETEIVGETVHEIELEGSTYHQLEIGPDFPPITWGIRGKYLIVCVGKNEVAKVFDSVRAGQPKWLKDLRPRLPVERVATVSYADLKQALELLKLPGPMPLPMLIEASGLNKLTTYASVTGLDKTGFVHRTAVGIDGEAKGVLSLLDVKPLAKDDLARIPADTPAAVALRLHAEKTYSNFVEMVAVMNGATAKDMEAQIDQAAGTFGIKVREQVVGSLGDHAYIYAAPQDGDLITGWTGVVQIRDYMTLFQVHQKLVGLLEKQIQEDIARGSRRGLKLKSMMVKHHQVYFLSVPDDDMPFSPSWCLTRDGMVFGLFPQAVKAHILRDAPTESLVNQPTLAEHLKDGDGGPVAFAYFDSKRVVELLYPLVQIGVQALANELRREDFDLDVSILPSVASITKHLQPRYNLVRRTASGIEIEGHQTLPGGSLGSSAPVLAAAAVPAIISAKKNARRMQAQNYMRQINLALHNFHDTHRGFPAAYSVDKDGKPLLSWRVHILPYIEQQALYDRFHLDEPWDSEHNKKLIEAMPQTYRSPASKAKPGHTNYLSIRGENTVITSPGENQKGKELAVGKRMADITDGTSNTAMIVEANDTSVVLWTKPDDFAADRKNPLKGLTGLYGRGFHVGLADGSVHFLSQEIPAKTLQLLFDRRDGKPVNAEEFDHGHRGMRHDHDHAVEDLKVEEIELKPEEPAEAVREEKPAAERPKEPASP